MMEPSWDTDARDPETLRKPHRSDTQSPNVMVQILLSLTCDATWWPILQHISLIGRTQNKGPEVRSLTSRFQNNLEGVIGPTWT